MMKKSLGNLIITQPTHCIVYASTIHPHVGNNAVVRFTHGLVGDSLTLNKLAKNITSFLAAILSKFSAINTCQSYPLTALCQKSVSIMYFGTFSSIFHLVILRLKNTLQACYNTITYKSPPMGTGGFEPPRQLASGCQDRHVCQFHHTPISENRGAAPAKLHAPQFPLMTNINPFWGVCQVAIIVA